MDINVVYAGDTNVVRCAGVSMISLFENNMEHNITVYFIEDNITHQNKETLKKIASQYLQKIIFLNIESIVTNLNIYDSKFPISAFSRLFVEKLPIDKCIYLDCDTLVCDKIDDLWNYSMEGSLMAGIQDLVEKVYRESIGLTDDDRYINSGVLLIDCKAMRLEKFSVQALDFIERYYNTYGTMVKYSDQGVINALLKNRIKIIEPQFNVMSPMLLYSSKDACKIYDMNKYYSEQEVDVIFVNPVIIHFVAGTYGRPWQKNCSHPYRKLYKKYLDLSQWKGDYQKSNLPFRRRIDKYLYKSLPLGIYIKIKKGYKNSKNENKAKLKQ